MCLVTHHVPPGFQPLMALLHGNWQLNMQFWLDASLSYLLTNRTTNLCLFIGAEILF